MVESEMHGARSRLAGLATESGRKWVLPKEMDWGAYRDRIRAWTTSRPTTNFSSEPLLRAAARFGWYVTYNEVAREWRLALLAPPSNFYWQDEKVDLPGFALRRDVKASVERLYAIVHPVANSGPDLSADWVFDQAEELEPNVWLERTVPRLRYDLTRASDYMAGTLKEAVILVAPKNARAKELQKRLAATPSRPAVTLVETDNPTAVTLLRVQDRLPLNTLLNYGEQAWQRHTVLPSLYVWPGEQVAAEAEIEGELFSSIFVGWLERDQPLLDRFAQAYLFELYDFEDERAYLPGLGEWPAESLGEALDNLMGGDESVRPRSLARASERAGALRELDAAIVASRQQLWQSPGKSSALSRAEAQLIAPLRTSGDRRERDLAIYLQGLISQI